ncbi:MAG: serine--tRNA ligase [Candidatus Omnitrophota bacterium]
MLDIKIIRENPEIVKKALRDRNSDLSIDNLLELDKERRSVLTEAEALKFRKNQATEEIAALKKAGKPADDKITSMKELSQKIKEFEGKVAEIDESLSGALMVIPNIPHSSVPVGSPKNNKIVKSWGEQSQFDFKPRTHIELAELLDIIDFPRASKITGSNFPLFKGEGARLVRALINFMVELHTSKHGYREIWPPSLVNRASMTCTGQLPKLEEDMYKLKDDDLFLIPTAEVPVTNIHRDEILEEKNLPVYYTAYTPCFRREAGSYGKDTKGLLRVHLFDKVELVKFVKPETSYDEHEKLLADAEEVLQLLGLPYRVSLLATGDLSFAAAKCYDIESWAAGVDQYLEVSSCSNFEAFQARRGNIRYRRQDTGKTEYVHTLNGSGIALARTIVAIMENYQQEDGSIKVPQALIPFMGGREIIGRE